MSDEKKVVATVETMEQENYKENVEAETDLEKAIVRQLEYYFGDINLANDKFLKEQMMLDNGWVPLSVLITFKRLAKLSNDTDFVAKSINKSMSVLLEVSEDKKKVRRNPQQPVPEVNEERLKDLSSRTLYAEGFPKNFVLDDLIKFFMQFKEVENIIMRKRIDRQLNIPTFLGSVFVTFKTKEQAQKFIDTKGLKCNDTCLLVLWKEDFIQKKREEYDSKRDMEKEMRKKYKLSEGTVLHFVKGYDAMTREDIREALSSLGGDVAYVEFKRGDTEGWVRMAKKNNAKEVYEKMIDGQIIINNSVVAFRLLEGYEEKSYLDKVCIEISKRRKNLEIFNPYEWRYLRRHFYLKRQGWERRQYQHGNASSRKFKNDS